jgi:hypothetical protein
MLLYPNRINSKMTFVVHKICHNARTIDGLSVKISEQHSHGWGHCRIFLFFLIWQSCCHQLPFQSNLLCVLLIELLWASSSQHISTRSYRFFITGRYINLYCSETRHHCSRASFIYILPKDQYSRVGPYI